MASISISSKTKRSAKPKIQFSPSNPTTSSLFHLINYDDTRTMMIVGSSSVKKRLYDNVLVLNDGRTAKLIVSGTKDVCLEYWNKQKRSSQFDENDQDSNHDGFDEDEESNSTRPTLQMPKKNFFTPAPYRRVVTSVHRSSSPDSIASISPQKRSTDDVRLKLPNKRRNHVSSIIRSSDPIDAEVADKDVSSSSEEEGGANEDISLHSVLQELQQAQTSLQESRAENRAIFDKLSKKISHFRSLTIPRKDYNLDCYRDPNDGEVFKKEIDYHGENLLDIPARNPGEYSRILLKTLFKPDEMQSSLLPSLQSKRFSKSELDHERFTLLNDALRARYRISKQHYTSFYKTLIQETLAGCLYNEGPRKKNRQTNQQQSVANPHLRSSEQHAATATVVTLNDENHSNSTTFS